MLVTKQLDEKQVKLLEIVEKYFEFNMEKFKESVRDSVNGYLDDFSELDELGVFEVMMCEIGSAYLKIVEIVLESIEDSVGVEVYGIKPEE